jgi:hypothetical protein
MKADQLNAEPEEPPRKSSRGLVRKSASVRK